MSSNDLNERVKGLLDTALSRFIIQDYAESLNELKSALMLDKENPILLYNIGICYCRMGLYNSAIQYLNRLLKLSLTFIDTIDVKKVIAYAMLKTRDFQGAGGFLKELCQAAPGDNQIINMYAYAHEKQKKYREAMELYKAIINNEPEYYHAFNSLAYVMALADTDLPEALQLTAKALKYNQRNPAFLDTAGYIYMKLGDYARAEKCLVEANKLLPLNGEIESHLTELIKLKKKK